TPRKVKVRPNSKRRRPRYRSSVWSRDDIMHAGAWLEDCLVQAIHDVFAYRDDNEELCIREAAIDSAAALAEQAMLRDPIFVASKHPPAPWTGFREGGYWIAESSISAPFVKTRDKFVEQSIEAAISDGSLKPHLVAASAQQAVPWRIDDRMLDIVKPYDEKEDAAVFKTDIATARQLAGSPFYVPKNIDWRGRFYGVPLFTFERQDWVRSLFRFDR